MTALDSVTDMNALLEQWNREQMTGISPIPILTRMAEMIEKETEAYYKMDPDPFDDRHPGRANPACALGHVMKALFKNEDFMNKLVSNYLMSNRDQTDLHTAACRLLLGVLPGLETSIVFQETDGLVRRLLHWAEKAEDPLRSYATGLLAGAMELQDVATNFKDVNSVLVCLMLRRLHDLKAEMEMEQRDLQNTSKQDENKRHFAMFSQEGEQKLKEQKSAQDSNQEPTSESETDSPNKTSEKNLNDINTSTPVGVGKPASEMLENAEGHSSTGCDFKTPKAGESPLKETPTKKDRQLTMKRALSPSYYSEDIYRFKKARTKDDSFSEFSNSSWAEMEPYVIGTFCLFPLSIAMKQRLILQYLTPMGEYQELISIAFERHAMELIFYYVNLRRNKDISLAFEAIKYLATLICHKKFAIEFLQLNGLQLLLDVYRPSIAATGVSLCLYYLSYFEDAMERVCLLPEHVLSNLVSYTLWLMECSHDSSRCHAAMFFGQAFPFRVILDLFDQKDGLRRLFNVISTLEILNVEDRRDSLSEDQIFTMRQSARHVSVAMKRYFEAHLAHKVDEIRRSHARNDGGSPVQEIPAYKAIKLTQEVTQENIEMMMDLMPVRMHWMPESIFHKLGGIPLLAQLIAMAPEWNNYPGKPETLKHALDVINVCTVTPKSQLTLLEAVPLPDNLTTPAISVLIGLAEGEVIADPEVQKSALNIIINCVCGPIERFGGGVGRYMGSGAKKKINLKMGEDVLSRMWNGVRLNNGIMSLLKLLSIKTPITDADSIRALACKALVGLSRSETVRQIMSKLPLFNNSQLQSLMKEPVLHDKRQEYVKFCKYANQLLERVSGKHSSANFDASLDDIRRADIVAQTRIIFQEKELLQLIHSHLIAEGFVESASVLLREANLPRCTTPPLIHPASPHLYSSPHQNTPKLSRQLSQPAGGPHSSISYPVIHNSQHQTSDSTSLPNVHRESPTSSTPSTPGPIRFTIGRHSQISTHSRATHNRCRFIREKDVGIGSPAHRSRGIMGKGQGEFDMTLDKIVTEYLRKQHALCRNPVSTCPSMSLFQPHRCPEPRGRRSAPANITSRLVHRSILPQFGGLEGANENRKYIYSRFRPIRTFRDADEDGFSCCAFSASQQYLIFGCYSGDLKLYNIQTGDESGTLTAHSAPISQCQPSRDGKLILTSYSGWGNMNGSSLWRYGDVLESRFSFDDEYVEFSKHIEDRIIGTKEETAHIYDIQTGQQILKLYDADKANMYQLNRATFNPTDDLVLNDGVLWDVRTGKSIHKFDKFNQYVSGVFHPMGLELIINSEVWDIRTFHLLHTVPALDQCQLRFNHSGDVIYAIHMDDEIEMSDDKVRSPFGSTFRTFDAKDYTNIATVDVKSRSISDLCTDKTDCFLAVVENQQFTDTGAEENVCKLYEVGKLRDADDDQPEEDEEEALDDDDDDDEDDEDMLNLDDSLDDSNDDMDGNDDENEEVAEDDMNGDDDDDDDDEEEFSVSDVDDNDEDDGDYDDVLFQLV